MTLASDATPIRPCDVRYIKLGVGGRWAQEFFQKGLRSFSYHSIFDHTAEEGDWNRHGFVKTPENA